ncbi:EexN family lipoprotein [Serratia symbiotica]|uniref:Plasmid protein n=1 Tax=Serratia symbiotica TaxID=138074 RepID=A0A455VJ11_9GAMM|nr:EexN family lipoprotein [Serratia symbiotica]BBI93069.1 plasmid protein [Serratia symbiotica]
MKKVENSLLIMVAILILSGCKEEVKSYAWYSEHQEETYQTYKKCKEKGEGGNNCNNAYRAAVNFSNELLYPKEVSDKFTALLK